MLILNSFHGELNHNCDNQRRVATGAMIDEEIYRDFASSRGPHNFPGLLHCSRREANQ
jgi:hypothetical protein